MRFAAARKGQQVLYHLTRARCLGANDVDGLALSSRNKYLDAETRAQALGLPHALDAMQVAFDAGERSAARLERIGRAVLTRDAGVDPDYLAVVDPLDLEPRTVAQQGDLVILAARVGTPRLLDNAFLGAPR